MADSRRGGRKPAKKAGEALERLTPVNLALNALAAFVAAPALFVVAVLLWTGQIGDEESRATNQHLFLGAVCILIGVFLILLSGLKVYEHIRARRRFNELLAGDRKSAVVQNLDELTRLGRALGPSYRRRLEARLDELGVKR